MLRSLIILDPEHPANPSHYLRSAKGNRALAARMLGISRRTLYTKLDELDIE